MRFVIVSPGTGNFYCGVCLRDDLMARALRRAGHEVLTVPIYLPRMREQNEPDEQPVFFGGIDVWLQQHCAWFRKPLPRIVDRALCSKSLLRLAAGMANMTDATKLGDMTLSMLRGEEGRQRKELVRLLDWLKDHPKPDVICLSTGLQLGMARLLRAQLGAGVVCFLQGEDDFLDALPAPWREQCWNEMAARSADADRLVAPSDYFNHRMTSRLGLPAGRIRTIRAGVDCAAFPGRQPSAEPAIGYLARLCAAKGFDLLVDAFIQIHRTNPGCRIRLHAGGAMQRADRAWVRQQEDKLRAAGLAELVALQPNLSSEEKIRLLAGASVFSVPARTGEAFGLYVAEALAAGVPCVLPEHAAFPEIIAASGGGRTYTPHTSAVLAAALRSMLEDPQVMAQCAESGRRFAHTHLSAAAFCRQLIALWEK